MGVWTKAHEISGLEDKCRILLLVSCVISVLRTKSISQECLYVGIAFNVGSLEQCVKSNEYIYWKNKAYVLSWQINASLGDTKWTEQNWTCKILLISLRYTKAFRSIFFFFFEQQLYAVKIYFLLMLPFYLPHCVLGFFFNRLTSYVISCICSTLHALI